MKIEQAEDLSSISLSQTHAIEKLAEACGIDKERKYHCNFPMRPDALKQSEANDKDKSSSDQLNLNGLSYRSVVGSLLFIMLCTRPDIATAVGILARSSNNPQRIHFEALKRVVGYLYKTKDIGITYRQQPNETANVPQVITCSHNPSPNDTGKNQLIAFSDADHGGSSDRKSTSGIVILMNGGPVVWSSKKQTVTALSTTESEVIAATECVKEVIHLRLLLTELGYADKVRGPTTIWEDNNACIALAHDEKNRRSAKHYQLRLRFLQEQVRNDVVKFDRVPTHIQVGDLLTKPLAEHQFRNLRNQMFGYSELEISKMA